MDAGELLFARVRMPDFFAGRGPTGWDIREPARIERQAREGLEAYLRGKGGALPAVDTGWVADLPPEIPASSFGSVERLPMDAIVSFALTAQRALVYLRNLVPSRKLGGLAARDAPRTAAERARLRRAAQALEDPVACLAALDQVGADHIDAIRSVYPAFYATVGRLAGESVSGLRRPLHQREDRALSLLLGVPVRGLDVLRGADQTQAGRQGPPGQPTKPENLQTSVQRVADR